MAQYQTEEQRVAEICSRVKGPSPDQQWQPKDRLPASLRARLDTVRIQAHHDAEDLRRRHAKAAELARSLEYLDQYGEVVAVEKKLEALAAKPDPIKSKNFLGKRRELVQRIRQSVDFIGQAETHLQKLKTETPDEYAAISEAAARVRTSKEKLAGRIAEIERHDASFEEFTKDFLDDYTRSIEKAKAAFAEAEAAIKSYSAGYKAESKSVRADIEAARGIAKPPVRGLLFGFGGKK